MKRVQAQLTEDVAGRLSAMSAQEGVSVSELLRRGAELVLRQGMQDTPEERRRRARSVVGRFSDGAGAAVDHDRYLDEAFGA